VLFFFFFFGFVFWRGSGEGIGVVASLFPPFLFLCLGLMLVIGFVASPLLFFCVADFESFLGKERERESSSFVGSREGVGVAA
jgi:hypothetical protein